jgi:putative nucleotidyltransferase with HDIG domain
VTQGEEKQRILFVDDEPKILKGFQRMLRNMRREWEMAFAENGYQALEMLSKQFFDVVVSDMCMPGMHGTELLERIMRDHPDTVRIVLSGHSDQKMILKSTIPAHRFLSKPCDAQVLISTVHRACALRDLLKHKSLKKIVSKIGALPSLPSLYTEIIEELKSPKGSIKKAGEIVGKDLGMSAKILQLVNSSFFGLPNHISNPSQAVLFLGLDTIKALALTIGLFSKLDTSILNTLNIKNIYEHSLNTGAIAREIARTENMEMETIDNSFMAGMLHDIGKLILALNFPDAYAEALKLADQEKVPFHDAEKKVIGATHAEVGAYLLGLWGLPDTIVEAVAFHHIPGKCSLKGFCELTFVHAANYIEHHGQTAANTKNIKDKFDKAYMSQFDLHDKLPTWEKISGKIVPDGTHDEQ